MKHYLIPIVLILSITTSQATIHTVSNDPNRPGQFTTIMAALNAANPGDTVYVSGSATPYSESVVINKRIVLIGAGYNSSNQLNLSTVLTSNLTLNKDNLGNDASGSVIMGFKMPDLRYSGQPTSNIQILRNQFTGSISVYGNNWSIINNLTWGISGYSPTNVLIQGNIITTGISGGFSQPSVIIDHNLFLYNNFSWAISGVQFATISNNIFACPPSTAFFSGVTSNSFVNNLTSSSVISNTSPTNSFAGGPNTSSGNFVGTNPGFVNAPVNGGVSLGYVYDPNANYRLQSTSPGKNAGTDGTDLGIYGGPFPFPSGGAPGSGFDTSAPPPIPKVTTMNIQNPSLVPGAQLKVTIQATVNN